MIELMILGFFAEVPPHGRGLREGMEHLHGHARTLSDARPTRRSTHVLPAGAGAAQHGHAITDPSCSGTLTVARATSHAERTRLTGILNHTHPQVTRRQT